METYAIKEKKITKFMKLHNMNHILNINNVDKDNKWKSITYIYRK